MSEQDGARDYSWALDPEQVRRATQRDNPQLTGGAPVAPGTAPVAPPVGTPVAGVPPVGVAPSQVAPPTQPGMQPPVHRPRMNQMAPSQPVAPIQQPGLQAPGVQAPGLQAPAAQQVPGLQPPAQQAPGMQAAAQQVPAQQYGQVPTTPAQRPRTYQVNTDVAPAPPVAPIVAAPPAPAKVQEGGASTRASSGRAIFGQQARENDLEIDVLLRSLVEEGGSDLHLTAGSPPMIRKHGSLVALEGYGPSEGEALRRTIFSILKQSQRDRFDDILELDTSYSIPGLARFRLNVFRQREAIGAVFRVIPFEIKPLEDLGIPNVVSSFAGLPRGLVLVTGPTGSGKSTTLASIIDLANRSRADHIMTVEDPIEFLHQHKKSIVNQREVGEDTKSFASALKHVLRQDPDIILVGEMRDLETISVALTAAETGHLVFATLHTQDAAQSIDRVIDVFPPEQQGQIRTQLAATIQGIVCQTLCKRTGRPGRAVATEVLVATPAIRNLIREGKTHQIYSALQAGRDQGMHTLDQHLADLVSKGVIAYETGLESAHHVEDYNKLTGRQARMSQGGSTLQQAASHLGGA